MTNPTEARFRPVRVILLRLQFLFAAFVFLQWALLRLAVFGSTPVIPVAFFSCVNLLCLAVALPAGILSVVFMIRQHRVSIDQALAIGLLGASLWLVFQVWAVCF